MEKETTLSIGWQKFKVVTNALSILLIPVVIGVLAQVVNASLKGDELSARYIELAISVLREEPNAETSNLRKWAIDIINHHSEIKLSEKASEELESRVINGGECSPVIDISGKVSINCGGSTINPAQLKALQDKLKTMPNKANQRGPK